MPIAVAKAATFPSYVDAPVPEVALRREYRIARRHEPAFSRAYLRLARGLYGPEQMRTLGGAVRRMRAGEITPAEAADTIEWFNPADPLSAKRWEMLAASVERALEATLADAAQGEFDHQGWPLRFEVRKARRDIRVPVNPFSVRWIRLRSSSLVRELSDQQRAALRELLAKAFEEGLRPEDVLEEIGRTTGLLTREREAVANRRASLIDAGEDAAAADALADRYAKQLLRRRAKRIARTETIGAFNQGLDDAWQLAREDGVLEAGAEQQWVELSASTRTCKICHGLGGQRVPLGAPFTSEFIGEVARPPAHPNCRCTKILVFP